MYRLAKITNMKVVPRLTHLRKFSSTLKPKQYKQNIDTTFSKYGNSTQRLDRPMSINSITKGLSNGLTNGLCNTLEFMSTCSEYTTNFMLKPISKLPELLSELIVNGFMAMSTAFIATSSALFYGTLMVIGIALSIRILIFIVEIYYKLTMQPYCGVCLLE